MARGLRSAHWRVATDTAASCSSVVPYCCMCRTIGTENIVGGPATPYGASNWPDGCEGERPAAAAPTLDRPDSPCVMRTVSQYPAAIAATACPTWMRKDPPPTAVPSIQRGRMPRYSVSCATETPAVATPSMSSRVSPASSSALNADSACNWRTEWPGNTPRSVVSAAPTIATLWRSALESAIRTPRPGGTRAGSPRSPAARRPPRRARRQEALRASDRRDRRCSSSCARPPRVRPRR